MDEEELSRKRRFWAWLDNRIVGPLLGSLITAIAAGKIVIQITGAQLSIGLTILVILCIYGAMALSFYMGMLFPILALYHHFTKSKSPWWYRLFSNTLTAPVLFFARVFDRQWRKAQPKPAVPELNSLAQRIRAGKVKTPDDQSPDTQ